MSSTEVRIILIILSLVVLALIYWFGKPGRKPQGRRREPASEGRPAERREPTLGGEDPALDRIAEDSSETAPLHEPVQAEMDVAPLLDTEIDTEVTGQAAAHNEPPHAPPTRAASTAPAGMARTASSTDFGRNHRGRRPADSPVDRIVSLLVIARPGEPLFRGPDIVVAAEKTGLEYGDMAIFHRLEAGKPDAGAVFSAANLLQPGEFDMATIGTLETPGLNLFMLLPGPLPALDAWDTMLPTARRLAELLHGQVVDAEQNALGRQRVAYMRDELRAWDRKHSVDSD